MGRILVYTGLRFALFGVAFVLLWVLFSDELSPWVLALFALLASSVASFFLLRPHAETAGEQYLNRWRGARERLNEAKRREDDESDDALDDDVLDEDADDDTRDELDGADSRRSERE